MRTLSTSAFPLAIPLVLLAACAQQPAAPTASHEHPHASLPADIEPQAIAVLRTPGGSEAGRVRFTETADGVHVQLEASGLTPGAHGVHLHAHGACAPGPNATTGEIVDFGAAGGHFDPGATRNHGAPNTPKHHVHAGELPNLQAAADGRATLHHVNDQVALQPGKTSVMGRTIVVHARGDDYRSDPDGNSGGRVLCGLIEPSRAGPVTGRTTLPGANVFPEGIAADPVTGELYVGSAREGHLYRFKPGAPQAELLQYGGSPGRQGAYGMKLDEQRQLWVAGGPTGTLAVVDVATAATVATAKAPPGQQAFVNDLALTASHVYLTDSYRPVVYRVVRNARPLVLEPWLDLNTTAVRYRPNEINLNGIVASADGRWLLAVQLVTGQLWRIDTRTRAVTEVPVTGGSLVNGDGLALQGPQTLHVVRNVEGEVARVDLTPDWSAGRVTQRLQDARLKYPTTAAWTPQGLHVVNGQLDRRKEPPALLPFDVLTLNVAR